MPSTSQNNDENDDEFDHTRIKSIVSKQDGKAFNVKFVQSDPTHRTLVVYSPVSKNANVALNTDGTLSEKLKMSTDPSQQFKLYKITDGQSYNEILGENSLGANEFSQDTKYPFYILKSVLLESRCLTYEPGNLFTNPIGNYNNQKWDVSQMTAPKLAVVTHNVEENALGSMNKNGDGSDGEIIDPNKIKINLNLTDELKQQLLGVRPEVLAPSNARSSNSSSASCGTQIPKNSLVSLCRGCDPDKL